MKGNIWVSYFKISDWFINAFLRKCKIFGDDYAITEQYKLGIFFRILFVSLLANRFINGISKFFLSLSRYFYYRLTNFENIPYFLTLKKTLNQTTAFPLKWNEKKIVTNYSNIFSNRVDIFKHFLCKEERRVSSWTSIWVCPSLFGYNSSLRSRIIR